MKFGVERVLEVLEKTVKKTRSISKAMYAFSHNGAKMPEKVPQMPLNLYFHILARKRR